MNCPTIAEWLAEDRTRTVHVEQERTLTPERMLRRCRVVEVVLYEKGKEISYALGDSPESAFRAAMLLLHFPPVEVKIERPK